MKRPRAFLTLLFLMAYLAIGAVAGTSILCFEADGRVLLEDAAHCLQAQVVLSEPVTAGVPPVITVRALAACDSCVDVGLRGPAAWSPAAALASPEVRPLAAFLTPVLLSHLNYALAFVPSPARPPAGALAFRYTIVLLS